MIPYYYHIVIIIKDILSQIYQLSMPDTSKSTDLKNPAKNIQYAKMSIARFNFFNAASASHWLLNDRLSN